MWRIYVTHLAGVFGDLRTAQQRLTLLSVTEKSLAAPMPEQLHDITRDGVEQALIGIGAHIKLLKMSDVITQQHQRLLMRFAQQKVPGKIADDIQVRFDELAANFLTELTGAYCLMIPPAQRELYEQKEAPFGNAVADAFPDAVFDIKAASRCMALDEWTATVFHLMRVLEVGLRRLARKLSIKMTTGGKRVDHAQWNDLLRNIQGEIKQRRNPPKKKVTPAQHGRLDWHDEMAAHFSNCNTAWRTHVSHVRGKYDQREAEEIWSHVKAFVQLLAAGPA